MSEYIAFAGGSILTLIICQIIRTSDAIDREELEQLREENRLLRQKLDGKRQGHGL